MILSFNVSDAVGFRVFASEFGHAFATKISQLGVHDPSAKRNILEKWQCEETERKERSITVIRKAFR